MAERRDARVAASGGCATPGWGTVGQQDVARGEWAAGVMVDACGFNEDRAGEVAKHPLGSYFGTVYLGTGDGEDSKGFKTRLIQQNRQKTKQDLSDCYRRRSHKGNRVSPTLKR